MSTPQPQLARQGQLHEKVAVITGASSGIGRAIALAFAAQGTKLVVCADLQQGLTRDDKETPSTDALIREKYGEDKALFVPCDVTLTDEGVVDGTLEKTVAVAVSKGGRLDIMVNNAGVGILDTKLHELSVSDWDTAMSVNARGVFLGSKYAVRQYLTQPANEDGECGCIINISSVGGMVGLFECAAYCASKAAVIGLTKATAVEYASRGIRANTIAPGYVDTPMIARFLGDEGFRGYLDTVIPAKRLAKPVDISGAAVWLANSSASAYVNGNVLPVDGGFHAR